MKPFRRSQLERALAQALIPTADGAAVGQTA
jgi:hypothetical protein